MDVRARGRAGWMSAVALVGAGLLLGCSGGESASGGGGAGDGAKVYAAKCAECHGANLEGTSKGPSHLSRVYEPSHHSDASFRRAIVQGAPAHHWNFGDMPPVQGMSDADVTAVIAFVRAQQQARGYSD